MQPLLLDKPAPFPPCRGSTAGCLQHHPAVGCSGRAGCPSPTPTPPGWYRGDPWGSQKCISSPMGAPAPPAGSRAGAGLSRGSHRLWAGTAEPGPAEPLGITQLEQSLCKRPASSHSLPSTHCCLPTNPFLSFSSSLQHQDHFQPPSGAERWKRGWRS